MLGDVLLYIAERIAIDVDSRCLACHEDGEAPIATAGIGDEPGPRLVHPLVSLAKLDERVLIQVFVHGQLMQMIAQIIRIAGLRMDAIHLIIKVSDEMLDRHTTSYSCCAPVLRTASCPTTLAGPIAVCSTPPVWLGGHPPPCPYAYCAMDMITAA